MKLFAVLAVLTGLYTYMMLHTTDIVLNQTQKIGATYQYVSAHADQIATGR